MFITHRLLLILPLLLLSGTTFAQRPTKTADGFSAFQLAVSVKPGRTEIPSTPAFLQQQASGDIDDLLRTAFSQLRQGQLDEALANGTKALAINPKDFRVHFLLGFVYQTQRKLKSASNEFAAAIQLAPDRKEIYLAKADVDSLRNAPGEALAALQKAVEIDPQFAEAHLMIGTILRWNEKRRSEAIKAYETALKLDPTLWEAYDGLGKIFELAKDEQRAEELFRKGMTADPKHMAGRFALGRLMVKQGRLAEARQLWDGRTSDEDRIFPQFIELLKRAERLKRATDALAQKPNDPEALVEMGETVMDGDHWVIDGRQKRALVYFRKALELKPDYTPAQYQIVKAYIQIAFFYKDENQNVDRELVKLRQMDAKLAEELDAYRKTFKAGIITAPPPKEND